MPVQPLYAADIPPEKDPTLDDFQALGCPVTVTTDDGTAGEKGFVTVPLEREMAG